MESVPNVVHHSNYLLQNDWEQSKPGENVWFRIENCQDNSKKNFNFQISQNGFLIDGEHTNSDDFSLLSYSNKCSIVKDKKTQVTHRFLPPTRIFSSIHNGSINALDVAPNGIAVSASSTDGTMKVWDTCGGVFKCQLNGHLADVNKCLFFPSNQVILSAGSDMLLKIWSAIDGSCPVTLKGHTRSVRDIAMIDKGQNIISVGNDGIAKLWSCSQQNCLEDLFDLSKQQTDCNVKLAINVCQLKSTPNNFDLGQRLENEPINENAVGTLNKLLLLGTESGFVYGIGLNSKQTIFNINCQSPVNCASFSAKEFDFFVGLQNGNVWEFDTRNTSRPKCSRHVSCSSVLSMITVSRPFHGVVIGRQDGSVNFYYDNHKEVVSLTGSDCDPIYQIGYDDKFVYTACRDGKVRKYFLNYAFE